MNIRKAYKESLSREKYEHDPAQIKLIGHLEALQKKLEDLKPRKNIFFRFLNPQTQVDQHNINGIYIWGDVGSGKTFLMDLFFKNLNIKRKKRVHFHHMMQDIHYRLKKISDIEDPIGCIAKDIARETTVLCFDEFFVNDIADAMILGRLLDGLFCGGVVLIATSNFKPNDLYKDGLQRKRFIPAIKQLNLNTEVFELNGGIDYRSRLLQQAGTYFFPNSKLASKKLRYFFNETASGEIFGNGFRKHGLIINDRQILAHYCAKNIAWFNFIDLCSGPRGPEDYIELARLYPSVIISGIPQFGLVHENQARRFITLVDEFYDRRVKLVISADVMIEKLYCGKLLSFEFERTLSRLIEMQSKEYLALPHLA